MWSLALSRNLCKIRAQAEQADEKEYHVSIGSVAVAGIQTVGTRMPTLDHSDEKGHYASTGSVADASIRIASSRMPTLEDGPIVFAAEVEGGTGELTEGRHLINSSGSSAASCNSSQWCLDSACFLLPMLYFGHISVGGTFNDAGRTRISTGNMNRFDIHVTGNAR